MNALFALKNFMRSHQVDGIYQILHCWEQSLTAEDPQHESDKSSTAIGCPPPISRCMVQQVK